MALNEKTIAALLFASLVAISGTTVCLVVTTNDALDESMPSFLSYGQLTDFIKAGSAPNGFPYNSPTNAGGDNALMRDETAHSDTNVQVSGVDESDTVKTDGECIYAATGGIVTIVQAYPPQDMRLAAQLNIANFTEEENDSVYVSGLFLNEDNLAVIFTSYNYGGPRGVYLLETIEQPTVPRTMLMVFDVSDPQSPTMRYSLGVSGYSIAERMIGSVAYIVSQSYAWIGMDQTVDIPRTWSNNESSTLPASDIYYDPETREASSFINVLAVDLVTADFKAESFVSGYASTVYMSQNALYVTFQKWAGSDIVSEPTVTERFDSARTTIYKIAVDRLSTAVVARGDVEGWLLNQFSMDESRGFLRVATTTEWNNMSNSVYVLDDSLSTVGKLLSIAPGERIYSARFVEDALYLVTFRQMDPLFVIDLSSPTDPRILGELTMPGFSTYLHPLDEHHLLGIGSENSAVKVSVYDVSNPASPVEDSKFVVPTSSTSSAEYDHKAVLVDAGKNLLVIPVNTWSIDSNGQPIYPSGAYVFNIAGDNGLTLKGVVQNPRDDQNRTGYWYYGAVYRSLYIGDYLYTLDGNTVMASSLDDLTTAGFVTYGVPSPYYDYPIYSSTASG